MAINRRPKGLQSYLDLKVQGINPSELNQVVQPTIGFDDFYYADNLIEGISAQTAIVPANLGATLSQIQCPQGQTWAIRTVASIIVNTDAGTPLSAYAFAPVLVIPGIALDIPLVNASSSFGNVSVSGGRRAVARTFERPLLISNGQSIGTQLADVGNLVTGTLQTLIAFYRLTT